MKTLLLLFAFILFTGTLLHSQQISIALSSTNVVCYGTCTGVIYANVSGGTAPYTYIWSDSTSVTATAVNLCAGSYTVTVTDANGTTGSATATINQPVPLYVSITTQNPTTTGGSDGSITANVTGGTPPYTYFLNNAQAGATTSNLIAGIYTLTVTDANNCSESLTIQLTEPNTTSCQAYFYYYIDSITFPSMTPVNFVDQSVPDSSGSIASWFWSFSDGSSDTLQNPNHLFSSGSYSICLTITTSSGCASTYCDSIYVNSCQLYSTVTTQNPTTFGGSDGTATVIVTGGTSPYSYLWSDDQTSATAINLSAGIYTVTVTDAYGCMVIITAQLLNPSLVCQASFNYSTDTFPSQIQFLFTNTSLPDNNSAITSYNWNFGDGSSDTLADPTHLFNAVSGYYTVCLTITTSSGCTSTFCDSLYVNPCQLNAYIISQNPTTIGGNDGSINLSLSGTIVPWYFSWNTGAYTEDISGLSAGTYSVTITNQYNCSPVVLTAQLIDQYYSSCQASFYYYLDSLTVPPVAPYIFVNQSVPDSISTITSWLWNFGDGNADSIANPVHTFYFTGSYIVCLTITTSSGCTSTYCDTINVNNNPCQLFANFIAQSPTTIGGNDGFIETSLSGGTAPYTYSWNTGQTTANIYNLTSGLYTLEVYDTNGCYNYFTKELFEPYDTTGGQIVDSLYTAYVDTCFNFQVDSFYVAQMIINNNNTITVTWVFAGNGNPYYITVEYTYTEIGNQVIYLTINCNGFKTLTTYMSYVHINTISNVSEIHSGNDLLAYPVPVTDILNVGITIEKQTDVILTVQNLSGQIIYQKNVKSNAGENLWKVDMESFAKGFYILGITVDGNLKAVRKITK